MFFKRKGNWKRDSSLRSEWQNGDT
jgi:hypothetical protein